MQGTAKVLSMLQSVAKVKEEEPEMELGVGPGDTEGGGTIVLDTIAEFCRQVGEKEEGERGWILSLIHVFNCTICTLAVVINVCCESKLYILLEVHVHVHVPLMGYIF